MGLDTTAFSAELDIIDGNPFVALPEHVLSKLFRDSGRSKSPIPVRGTINGRRYQQTLVTFRASYTGDPQRLPADKQPENPCSDCRGSDPPVVGWLRGTGRVMLGRMVASTGARPAADLVLLRRAKDRMDREFARPLDVESVARAVGMSAGHFSRRFAEEFGEPPYRYLMTRRVERAMALLRSTDLSVTNICFAVGFSSLGTFSTRFSELVGMSPTAYRSNPPAWVDGVAPCVAMRVTKPVRNREVTDRRPSYVAGHEDHDPPELPAPPRS